jgi:hypothetical protein
MYSGKTKKKEGEKDHEEKENYQSFIIAVSCTGPWLNRSGYLYDKKTGTGRQEKN